MFSRQRPLGETRRPVRLDFKDDLGKTRQEFKKETDINQILKKYQKTGLLTFVNRHQGSYGDFTGIDLRSSIETFEKASDMFMEMPSEMRKHFQNDPIEFLNFVNDKDNFEKAKEMGLIVDPPPEPVQKVEIVNPPPVPEPAA